MHILRKIFCSKAILRQISKNNIKKLKKDLTIKK